MSEFKFFVNLEAIIFIKRNKITQEEKKATRSYHDTTIKMAKV